MGTLGCAKEYNAIIHYQGGELPFYQIPNQSIAEVTWQRILDDTSRGTVRIKRSEISAECCARLGELDAWGFELSIYRDSSLVWQGPLYDIGEDPYEIFLDARDVIGYVDHRRRDTAASFLGVSVGLVFVQLFSGAFINHDPNVQVFADIDITGPSIDWDTPIDVYIGDELRELAKAGYDFTTMGRRVVGRLERPASGYTDAAPILTDQHFAGTLSLRRVGAETVTRALVVGDGVSSSVGGPTAPFYGQVDKIDKMDRVTDVGVLTEAALHWLNDGSITPTYLVIPPEGKLLPTAPVTVEQLMCGERIDVYAANTFCRPVQQSFKLLQVNGRWAPDPAGETIGISVGPLPLEEG